MKLYTKGYYLTKSKEFTDWHAGHKEVKHLSHFLKVFDNNSFIWLVAPPDFDILNYLKSQYRDTLLKDTSTAYGKYLLKDDNIIVFKYRVMDTWDMEFELEIITPELLKDKDGRYYHFIPVDEEKLKGLPEL